MTFEIGSSNLEEVHTAGYALLVDDDPFVRNINSIILSRFGFITLTAENGRQAVELCQSGAHFDLIIMDLELPVMDGVMDGIEATQILRAMGVKCKIIGMTYSPEDSNEERFTEAGADHFFYKPLNAAKLTSSLKNM